MVGRKAPAPRLTWSLMQLPQDPLISTYAGKRAWFAQGIPPGTRVFIAIIPSAPVIRTERARWSTELSPRWTSIYINEPFRLV